MGLKGRFGSGPAAVTGDKSRLSHWRKTLGRPAIRKIREPEDLPVRLSDMLLVTGRSYRQCHRIPPFFHSTFHPLPLLAVAGRKEDEVNQGAILRAFLPWGFFYFQEKGEKTL